MMYRQAIENAGHALHLARVERDSLPPRAAARAAWEPSGPSVDEIEAQIAAQRQQVVMAA